MEQPSTVLMKVSSRDLLPNKISLPICFFVSFYGFIIFDCIATSLYTANVSNAFRNVGQTILWKISFCIELSYIIVSKQHPFNCKNCILWEEYTNNIKRRFFGWQPGTIEIRCSHRVLALLNFNWMSTKLLLYLYCFTEPVCFFSIRVMEFSLLLKVNSL